MKIFIQGSREMVMAGSSLYLVILLMILHHSLNALRTYFLNAFLSVSVFIGDVLAGQIALEAFCGNPHSAVITDLTYQSGTARDLKAFLLNTKILFLNRFSGFQNLHLSSSIRLITVLASQSWRKLS